eukprot:TRINITY_DN682_c0_g1_i14.p1 TRINITY_DN682_c0_g1~~TRINITY_DN682_c0_g1_i14.p1  ORF type:complete len:519 (-),score=93.74 TRINITY_DN682_c0_g1_i14:115-1671(-)
MCIRDRWYQRRVHGEERKTIRSKTIYIIVENKAEELSYYMKLQIKDLPITLQDGVEELDELDPLKNSTFVYDSYNLKSSEKELVIKIKITSPWNANLSDISFKPLFAPSDQEDDSENYRHSPKVMMNVTNTIEKTLIYSFAAQEETYHFQITNTGNEKLEYTFKASVNDFSVLRLNDSQISFLTSGRQHSYEVFVSRPGTLSIHATACFGNLYLAGYHSREELAKNNYTFKVDDDVNNYELEGLMEVDNAQKVYLSVNSLQSIATKKFNPPKNLEAFYKIGVNLLEPGAQPKKLKFSAGNKGRIELHHLGDTRYKVKFSPIMLLANEVTLTIDFDAQYFLLLAVNPIHLDVLARCGEFIPKSSKIGTEIKEEYHVEQPITCKRIPCEGIINIPAEKFDSHHPNSSYFVTVRALVHEPKSEERYHVVYSTQQFEVTGPFKENLGGSTSYLLYIGIGLIVVVALLVMLWCYRRRLKQRIDYEMQDVRAVGGIKYAEINLTTLPAQQQTNQPLVPNEETKE